jgi:hypothetical protein
VQYLPDINVECPACHGARFNDATLEVRVDGFTISDVLGLTVHDALSRFAEQAPIAAALRPVDEVGLGYLRLGEPTPSLSGGEAQRLRVAARALRWQGLDREDAALWNFLAAQAHYANAIRDRRVTEIGQALASIRIALELLPEDHDLRGALTMYTSRMLQYRFLAGGSLADGDAATAYMRATRELFGPEQQLAASGQVTASEGEHAGPVLGLLDAYSTVGSVGPLAGGERASAEPAIARLRQALDGLPEDNEDRYGLMGLLGATLLAHADRSGDRTAAGEGLRLLIQAADQAGEDSRYHAHLNDWAAHWQARAGIAARDIRLIDEAISRVSAPPARPGLVPGERARRERMLGTLLGERYMLSGRTRDIDRSIEILGRCRRYLGQEANWRAAALLLELAENYRIRGLRLLGDQRRAIKTGLAGLREVAADVLLQTGTRRGLDAARGAQSWAGTVALWCLIDNHPDQALQALELGRSLVLHAATVAADVPGMLRSAGRDDLAGRWEQEAGRTVPLFDVSPLGEADTAYLSGLLELPADDGIPSDVRQQMLAALGGTSAGAELLTPATTQDLAGALRGAGYDAFVYLLPPDPAWTRNGEHRPGCALILRANGHVHEVPLPLLADGPVAAYDVAHQAWIAQVDDTVRHRQWDLALEALCDWAWVAMAGPVLGHVAEWRLVRPPRLVLIPTGNLGMVPWHAARTRRADGRLHYAVEDAVFSYAASGRQLISAVRRSRKPWADTALLIGDTTGDLPMAALEVQELRRLFYPAAVLLGQPGDMSSSAAAKDEVLARLPGGGAAQASLLHCCCHASVCGDLSSSFLQLADGERLTVADIMAQAEGRNPQAPGYLAVLSACTSDFADVDHDEALTLASALLAAGALGVVGTRWPADDLAAAELMVAFHHFLNREGTSPADALREAQLWMLDQDRVVPEDLSQGLADRAAASRFRKIRYWAAFTYQGA